MCLSHVWYYHLGYCVLDGNWVLDGCDDYHLQYQLVYTNLFGMEKMVSLQSFHFKGTKILV